MKEKITIFLIGLLIGSIISTGSIYIYTKANNNTKDHENRIPFNNESIPPEIPNNQKNNK